jgi:hypothetical protein
MLFSNHKENIIAIRSEYHGRIITDFCLQLLAFKNTYGKACVLEQLRFDIFSGKDLVQTSFMPQKNLAYCLKKSFTWMDSISADKDIHKFITGAIFGMEKFWKVGQLSDSLKVGAGKIAAFRLVVPMKISYSKPVDRIVISLVYKRNSECVKESIDLNIIEYKSKNKYIFPAKGNWVVTDTYQTDSHRHAFNSEFAFDAGQLNDDLMMIMKPFMHNADYPQYGKDLVAVADGKVIDLCDGYPEPDLGYGKSLPWEKRQKSISKFNYKSFYEGNYVVIQFDNNESALYCHLKPGSVRVKRGKKVRQGEVIGQVGNTGNSICPHIHFHVFEGTSLSYGRSLPFSFTNITDIFGKKIKGMLTENSIVHAE